MSVGFRRVSSVFCRFSSVFGRRRFISARFGLPSCCGEIINIRNNNTEVMHKYSAVVDESKVLVVQDRNKTKNAWKFPGGLSDLGENIDWIELIFLSIRQQHNHPGAFGMSDMYLICRLSPLSYHIDFCTQECLRCEWFDLAELAKTSETTPITSRIAKLLLYGLENGFHNIDLTMEQLPAVYSSLFYQLYHRRLPEV